MKDLLLSYVKYNLWANKRLCKRLEGLDEQIWNAGLKSSFKTIKLTLLHIWDAQQVWNLRLNGKSISDWPGKSFTGTNTDIILQFIEQSSDMIRLADSYSEEKLNSMCEFNDMKGNPYKMKVCDILLHCMNHSTFHRGQIVTMLRELVIDNLPGTDYITYARETLG